MYRFLVDRTGAPEYLQALVEGDGVAQEAAGLSGALDEIREDPTEDWIFSHKLLGRGQALR